MRSLNFILLSFLIICSLVDSRSAGSTRKDTVSLDFSDNLISLVQLNMDDVIPKFKNSMKNQINQKNRINRVLQENLCDL